MGLLVSVARPHCCSPLPPCALPLTNPSNAALCSSLANDPLGGQLLAEWGAARLVLNCKRRGKELLGEAADDLRQASRQAGTLGHPDWRSYPAGGVSLRAVLNPELMFRAP